MRTLLVALMLASVVLAGCSDAPKETPVDELEGLEQLEATATTGVIRGVVLDEAIVPVADVRITLTPGDVTTTSNEAGAFGFEDLEPGTYFLTFRKAGYPEVQQSTEVVAGDSSPPVVKVQMVRIPGTEPFATYLHYKGYIGCAIKVANDPFTLGNVCSSVDDPNQFDILDFETTIVPEILQTEIVWDYTQDSGRQLGTTQNVQDADGNRQRVGNVWGESPLVCRVTSLDDCTNDDGTGGGGEGLNVTQFPGQYYANVYTACYPQCAYGAVGFGLVLQQDYDLYATAFFNYAPPDDWTLQDGGRYDPPL